MWSSEKKKILIAVSPELYCKIENYAAEQNRSIVNSITYLLEKQLAQGNQTSDDGAPLLCK